jgi:hypothetical protein
LKFARSRRADWPHYAVSGYGAGAPPRGLRHFGPRIGSLPLNQATALISDLRIKDVRFDPQSGADKVRTRRVGVKDTAFAAKERRVRRRTTGRPEPRRARAFVTQRRPVVVLPASAVYIRSVLRIISVSYEIDRFPRAKRECCIRRLISGKRCIRFAESVVHLW